VKTGLLSLRHAFPSPTSVRASVDVKLILENLNHTQTDVGQWVHVVGYVTSTNAIRENRQNWASEASVDIQALVLWSACDLDIAAYENSFRK
jgi:hypothetical protein